MANEREHLRRVRNYYEVTQPFYRLFWHGPTLGLHYGFWDGQVSNRYQAIERENEVLADLVDAKNGELVLDSGCGIGGSSLWLAQERGASVVGIDVVQKQLTKARELAQARRLTQRVSFKEGDYQKLKFDPNMFDVYWSLESLEHATNVEKVIEEAHRVLKPGGRIVIAATFKSRNSLSSEELRQLRIGMSAAGCFNDFRIAEKVAGAMEQTGFVDVKNLNKTDDVMNSARQMTIMCQLGLPFAKAGAALHLTSPILILNNQWGTYQEGLFKSGATSYNVLLGAKPK